ncbi:MAG TPA: efflux RND transporter periplasmic adaptor subunit [Tepidisphaeraceae bacterium]|nr:efflux RND transporter periplasmic adaptor subunit [Tepidisphaeraceae bacterium]
MRTRRGKTIAKWVIACALVVAAGAVGLAFFWFSRPVVMVTQVVEGRVVKSFYATGNVQPVTEYPIKTSNAGVITRVAEKGQRVKKGDVLAVVEYPQLKFALDKAQADLELARRRADGKTSPVLLEFDAKLKANVAMLDNATREAHRMAEMAPRGASSSDVEKAADHVQELASQGQSLKAQRSAAMLQLQTDLQIAQAALAAAQRNFDLQTLRSPVEGDAVVLDRPIPLGSRLNVNDQIMRVADVHPANLRMRAQVDEENIKEAREGQAVFMSLYSFPDASMKGTVTKIYDKADPDRRTFEVDVTVDPNTPQLPALRAGMTGELAFIIASKAKAPIAPAQALQNGALYTVRDGRLKKVPGNNLVGIRSVERVEVLAGLHPGDPIVISPIQNIEDGASVRTAWIDPVAAAGLNTPKTDSTFKGFN